MAMTPFWDIHSSLDHNDNSYQVHMFSLIHNLAKSYLLLSLASLRKLSGDINLKRLKHRETWIEYNTTRVDYRQGLLSHSCLSTHHLTRAIGAYRAMPLVRRHLPTSPRLNGHAKLYRSMVEMTRALIVLRKEVLTYLNKNSAEDLNPSSSKVIEGLKDLKLS